MKSDALPLIWHGCNASINGGNESTNGAGVMHPLKYHNIYQCLYLFSGLIQVIVFFTRILQDYFTGIGAIMGLPQCQ